MIKLVKIFLGIYLFIVFVITLAIYSPFYIIFNLIKFCSNIINYLAKGLVYFYPQDTGIELLHRPFENQNYTDEWIPVTENDFDNKMSEEEF